MDVVPEGLASVTNIPFPSVFVTIMMAVATLLSLVGAVAAASLGASGAPAGPGPNGLALTPPMGWMSWEIFRCETDCTDHPDRCVNEQLYQQQAAAIAEGGVSSFLAAGYNQVSIGASNVAVAHFGKAIQPKGERRGS
jgi:hypothetical protein